MLLCVCVRLRRDGQRFLTACLIFALTVKTPQAGLTAEPIDKTKWEQSTCVCFVCTSTAEVSYLPWKEAIELKKWSPCNPSVMWSGLMPKCHNNSLCRRGGAGSEVHGHAGVWQTWNVHGNKLARHFQMSKVLALMGLSWLWLQGISGRGTVVSSHHLVVKQRQSSRRQVGDRNLNVDWAINKMYTSMFLNLISLSFFLCFHRGVIVPFWICAARLRD